MTVTVSFPENQDNSEKTYTVGVSPASQLIKSSGTVTITQGYPGDLRRKLTAGPDANAGSGETSASVTFTGAEGLTELQAADFTVTFGAAVSDVSVTENTVTVTISFSANTALTQKTYTVAISPLSQHIRGGGSGVKVTQMEREILKSFYVSSSGGNDEKDGLTEATAWQTIAKVNTGTYEPGDAIRFKSGDTWTWTGSEPSLAPQGSGTAADPIRITSYGGGDKPKFEGKGLVDDIIYLHNQEYWEISNLEISNTVEGFTNPTSKSSSQGALLKDKDLRGIHVSGDNGSVLDGFNLHDLYIHDVTGEIRWIGVHPHSSGTPSASWNNDGYYSNTGWNASKRTGAILFEALDGGSATTFNNVTVENNVLERNSFGGFTIKQVISQPSGNRWGYRNNTSYPYTDSNFKPHTNITVRGNYIDQTGWYKGDGIYLTSVQGALVENNVVKNPGVCGIELYIADDIIVQHNEVYGSTAKGGGSDSNAIDPDSRVTNTIIQYNYVHHNGDGIMMCGYSFNTVIVRYNVLYNNTGGWIRDTVSGGVIQVYNNVLYNDLSVSSIRWTWEQSGGGETWEFKNNVLYNAAGTATGNFAGNFNYQNNFYYGISNLPSGETAPVTGDPKFSGIPAFGSGTSADSRFRDFSLLMPAVGSPLINQGVAYTTQAGKIDIAINNKDYAGVTLTGQPDLGLFAVDFTGLAGIVTDSLSNQPVFGATVKLNDSTTTITDADGKYSFATVPYGSYTITVTADGFSDSSTSFTANADALSWLPLTTGEIATNVPKTVTGTITDNQGAALSGVTVTIIKGETTFSATSGSDGKYTIADVPAGSGYTITAAKSDYKTKTADNIVIAPSQEPVVNFDLLKTLTGTVIYDMDFDGLTVGTFSDTGWQFQNSTAVVEADPDNAGKVLRLTRSGTFDLVNKTAANASSNASFTIEARVKRTAAAKQWALYTNNNSALGTNSSSVANILLFDGGIHTHANGGGSSATTQAGTLALDTWCRIAVVVSVNSGGTDTFDFYVDGEMKLDDKPVRNDNPVNYFHFYSSDASGDLILDYFRVYAGSPQ